MRFAMAALLPLAACAPDNPENIPQRGDWEMETRITSLSVAGHSVPKDMMPPEFRALETTERKCGEPMFTDPKWQSRDISGRTGGKCALETYEVAGTIATGSGACKTRVGNQDFNPDLTVRAELSEQYYTLVIAMEGDAEVPGLPGSSTIRAVATQNGRRLGDC